MTGIRALTLSLIAALCAAAPAGAADRLGFVANHLGDVQIQSGGDGSFEAARVDRAVEPGDVLRTGKGARAQLMIGDELMLILSENTELRVPEDAESRFEQVRGRARFAVLGGTRAKPGVRVAIGDDLFVHGWAVDFELWRAIEPQDGERPWRVCNVSGGLEIRGSFGVIEPKDDRCNYLGVSVPPSEDFVPEEPPDDYPSTFPGIEPGNDPPTPPVATGPDEPGRDRGIAADMLGTPEAAGVDWDELEPDADLPGDVDLPGGIGAGAGGGPSGGGGRRP